ncbi:Na+/H+ antiporter NhaC family protein [Methanobrevibacter sp.]|uniref:Na+/H+ antiporter NhaC family protein n=1 Tax=Methanobrevibacter sp. TaxID=66852 RepID=UPI0025FB34E3|nr:Na+/H+ antiporter NhaC family protein [Methanobrevibacter sp.]MEE0943682.1 Na+/H+ antiporter NhaC family protein [Methanobrevibacter sp.]
MNINNNMKIGIITAVSVIALFVLSLLITQAPATDNPAAKFGILTLLPPIVAISLAFITKETILSLFVGVFIGEFMLCVNDLNIVSSAVNAFLAIGNEVISCMADPWNAGIILQCLLIGGVIQLITKMGGAKALADSLAKRANTPRKAQLSTWFLGLCVFFDDYANSLIVGPIMRPVMDKLKVSRQKLAFIVDATAAPVAGIAIISTWIGLEISLIASGFKSIGMDVSGFGIFLQTIPYRFYNILILIFIVMSATTLYEFGPMKKAEQEARARKDSEPIKALEAPGFDEIQPVEGVKLTVWNAIIPIGTLVIGALISFYWSGYTTILSGENQALITLMKTAPLSFNGIFEALSASNASVALFQAALLASIVAILMAVLERIMTIEQAISEWVSGMKSIAITGVILLLAWSLGGVIGNVGTADYLAIVLKGTIPYWILPSFIFVLGALISFATGTAYGTMSILMPLTIPLAWAISPDIGFVVTATSGVLTGAIFGDHCSPISDTTILSSMGTSCNHIDHVQTQIYYAIFVAIIAILFGYIPAGFGIAWYICIPVAIIVMYIGLKVIGEKVDFEEIEEESA